MRAIITTFISTAWLLACGSEPPPRHAFAGPLPSDTQLDMAGTFKLSPEGDVVLTLTRPCTVEVRAKDGAWAEAPCDRARLDAIRVEATTPWAESLKGTWTNSNHVVFHVDWKRSPLDPLDPESQAAAGKPWTVAGMEWKPNAAEAAEIMKLVGKATETEADLERGGASPSLEVTTFEVEGRELHSGSESTLAVRISNRGPGTAYRVVATTRSSIDGLHGHRLAFGMIRPGTEKLRRVKVTVPLSETGPDTMLVLVLAEGNGFAPQNVSRRVQITPSATGMNLALRCAIAGHEGNPPDVDAGESVVLRCSLDNTGKGAGRVELEAAIGGGAPTRGQPQDVAAGGHATVSVPFVIPQGLAIDTSAEIAVTARDNQRRSAARTTVAAMVRKPRLCISGQLTRAQYKAKLTELRAAVAAGDLTQAQLDRYDAELVSCLK